MKPPEHIANAPMPRTDEKKTCAGYCHFETEVAGADDYQQLERELIYANEVMEKLNSALEDLDRECCREIPEYERPNDVKEALSAYESYKANQKG